MGKRNRNKPRIDPQTAMSIIDDDMPDGAYFAMLEDLTGMCAADAVMHAERQRKLDKPFQCDQCNKRCATEWSLNAHKRDKHGESVHP